MNLGKSFKNIVKDSKKFTQNYADTYRGLATGNFGQARDSFIKSGVNVGQSLGLIDREKAAAAAGAAPVGPDRDAVTKEALAGQAEMLKKKRASRTLFAGGGMDSSPGASSILLGGY